MTLSSNTQIRTHHIRPALVVCLSDKLPSNFPSPSPVWTPLRHFDMFITLFLVVVSILQQGHARNLPTKSNRAVDAVSGVIQPPVKSNSDGLLVLPTLNCVHKNSYRHGIPRWTPRPELTKSFEESSSSPSEPQERPLNMRSTTSTLYTLTHSGIKKLRQSMDLDGSIRREVRDETFRSASETINTMQPILSPSDILPSIGLGFEKISRTHLSHDQNPNPAPGTQMPLPNSCIEGTVEVPNVKGKYFRGPYQLPIAVKVYIWSRGRSRSLKRAMRFLQNRVWHSFFNDTQNKVVRLKHVRGRVNGRRRDSFFVVIFFFKQRFLNEIPWAFSGFHLVQVATRWSQCFHSLWLYSVTYP